MSDFFKQAQGAALGLPLSPTVANLYMEAFEERQLTTANMTPTLWLRYVDDVFKSWRAVFKSIFEQPESRHKVHNRKGT